MANQLFRRKPIDKIVKDVDLPGDDIHSHGLKRVLTVRDLTFFGIAAIIGAGSFSSLGGAVFNGGPGVVILFIITGIACAFTAFCYSEFASRIPVAGSAYTYAYASFGELFAWIIGWALIMEYSIGNIYVAFSWSDYFTSFLSKLNIHIPDYLTCSYREAQKAVAEGSTNTELLSAWNNAPVVGSLRMIFDLPALVINLLITYLVYRGIKESRNFSNAMVVLKLAIVGLIIIVGGVLVFSNGLTFNWTPPDDTGVKSFMPNGFGGVMMAVSGVFFAYIGFDAVSVLAEESKNPQRDLPRAMILSLVVCTIVYILLTLVLTGAVNYRNFDGVGDPLAFIFEKQNLNIGWMQVLVSICAVVAMTSVLLVFQMGQPRMWMSMSRDGLMPPAFQKIHKKFKTPSFATIVTGLVVGIPILFTDKTFVLDFTSIATLFAFVLVCGGVLLLPRKEKIPGRFSMPYINGQFIFPLIIATAIILLSVMTKGYFKDNIDFSMEKKIDKISSIIPSKNVDTTTVSANLEKHLSANVETDSVFIKFSTVFSAASSPAEKVIAAKEFVSNYDTTQSRTAKVSLTIFWILMVLLSVLAFLKKYSLIPLLGVSTCLYLLTGMTLNNWLWFGGWLLLGLIIYFLYGYKKSRLANTPS